jgi:hypothetical protein
MHELKWNKCLTKWYITWLGLWDFRGERMPKTLIQSNKKGLRKAALLSRPSERFGRRPRLGCVSIQKRSRHGQDGEYRRDWEPQPARPRGWLFGAIWATVDSWVETEARNAPSAARGLNFSRPWRSKYIRVNRQKQSTNNKTREL